MIKELSQHIRDACVDLFDIEVDPELTRPEEQFGDFATNAALRLAPKLGKPPREIAEAIAEKLSSQRIPAEVAGPGFVNICLSDKDLFDSARDNKSDKPLESQTTVVEYSDPNPFKILHAGHLYTTLVGDAIANILEQAGADVHRANYGGDVGLHVAKSMWAILQDLGGEHPEKLADIASEQKLKWLSQQYIKGNNAYEQDEHAKNAINQLNKRIYGLHEESDKSSPFARIYWTCRQWSYDGFEDLYAKLKVEEFEKYYPESSVTKLGLETIRAHLGKVYEESEGAVVFRGEESGLHTRVFITKSGIPTYEAKDVGLLLQKRKDYEFDRSVVITANEQAQYMQVVLASVAKFEPKLVDATIHLTHGMVKLAGGVKMSSRKGNFLTADEVLSAASKATANTRGQEKPLVTLGAIKYAFLKNHIGGDIIYDAQESVNLEGNSGPYLQYALVRAKSILGKGHVSSAKGQEIDKLDKFERTLARKLGMYPEVFSVAAKELSPHHICTYLYELAQTFNRFYENSQVLNDPRSHIRLKLVESYAKTLEDGLRILGIPVLEKM